MLPGTRCGEAAQQLSFGRRIAHESLLCRIARAEADQHGGVDESQQFRLRDEIAERIAYGECLRAQPVIHCHEPGFDHQPTKRFVECFHIF